MLKAAMKNLRRQESGFTLVELLVASALALVVVGVSVMLITSALKSEPRTSSRSGQIEAGRVMLERITRELREGCKVEGDERALAVYMNCNDELPTYRYVCSAVSCTRVDVAGGKSELMVSGLEDDGEAWPVFVVDDRENYVEVQLRFPRAEGGEAVTLSDGVAMRNQTLAAEPPQ